MTRIVIGLVVALALTSCTSSGGGGAEDGDEPEARSVKAEVDEEAKEVLPDLSAEVGGELGGMKAAFYERSGFGIWDYEAKGQFTSPPGTMDEKLDGAQTVLESHGYAVERDEGQKRVTGQKGNVSVIVQAALLSDDEEVSALQLSMGSIDPASAGDDFAGSAPPEDYLALVE